MRKNEFGIFSPSLESKAAAKRIKRLKLLKNIDVRRKVYLGELPYGDPLKTISLNEFVIRAGKIHQIDSRYIRMQLRILNLSTSEKGFCPVEVISYIFKRELSSNASDNECFRPIIFYLYDLHYVLWGEPKTKGRKYVKRIEEDDEF